MPRSARKASRSAELPVRTVALDFEGQYSSDEVRLIAMGLRPAGTEDKWLIYTEDNWLLFRRSWTGFMRFRLRFERTESGAKVAESWVRRPGKKFRDRDLVYERQLVAFLIDALLLHKRVEFPVPPELAHDKSGLLQHHVTGTAYPEATSSAPKQSDA